MLICKLNIGDKAKIYCYNHCIYMRKCCYDLCFFNIFIQWGRDPTSGLREAMGGRRIAWWVDAIWCQSWVPGHWCRCQLTLMIIDLAPAKNIYRSLVDIFLVVNQSVHSPTPLASRWLVCEWCCDGDVIRCQAWVYHIPTDSSSETRTVQMMFVSSPVVTGNR